MRLHSGVRPVWDLSANWIGWYAWTSLSPLIVTSNCINPGRLEETSTRGYRFRFLANRERRRMVRERKQREQ